MMIALIVITLAVPPAAKALAVIATVYGILQGLKQVPALTQYLTGWIAVAVNVLLTAGGLLIAIPADQLYTTNTLVLLITTILGSAGVHGTVKSMSQPTVLATVPPSTQVKSVAATLVPDNPAAVSVVAPKEPVIVDTATFPAPVVPPKPPVT